MAASAMPARLSVICAKSSLVLAMCLALAVPFGPGRNVDGQGLLLLVIGGLAWTAVLSKPDLRPAKPAALLAAIFLLAATISALANPHLGYNLLGAPFVRLGLLSFVAYVGFGWLLAGWRLSNEVFIRCLYGLILAVSTLSVPYTLIRGGSFGRLGGVFAQPDIFAIIVACGVLLGGYFLQKPISKRPLLLSQLVLVALLLLSGTRAAVLLLLVLYPLAQFCGPRPWRVKRLWIYLLAAFIAFAASYYVLPSRYHDFGYARQSISYRLSLQDSALEASWHKPLAGYGPGNLADALACSHLQDKALLQTCHEGYFFSSSHNIFLDRVLAVGWLGGLAYAVLVTLAVYKGLRGEPDSRVLAFCMVLIGVYYLTNVTSVILELLLWALIARCLVSSPRSLNKH